MDANLENDLYFKHLLDEGVFKVLEDGTIINVEAGRICKRSTLKNTYQRITFRGKGIQAHRLVWIAFNGLIPYKIQINHKDGKKYNNHPSNLELATNRTNTKHAFDNGLNYVSKKSRIKSSYRFIGEKNINSKISDSDVINVRRDYIDRNVTTETIQNTFNMSRRAVEKMLLGQTYKHLPFAVDKLTHKPGRKGKLNKNIADTIRKQYAAGDYSQAALAKKYGVARGSIKDIINYRSYK